MGKTQKKNKEKKPLERHILLEKKLLENTGKGKTISLSKAMREVGYSEGYAKNPQDLKKTRSWDTLMKEVLNDEFLMQQHLELFNAKEVQRFIFPTRLKDPEIIDMVKEAGFKVITIRPSPLGKMAFYSIPNARAKKDALDFAYKLKNKYAPEEYNLKFKGFTKEQLIDLILGKITKKK